MRRAARVVAVLATVACLVGAACGGGGGGGGGGITDPTPSISFTPAAGSATNSVGLGAASANGEELVLELVVRAVADLYGVSCDVTYPAALLRFVDSTPGSVLAAGGAPTSVQVVENPPGRLVVGATRLGDVGSVASASGPLLSLRFQAVAAGSGSFSYVDPRAFDERGQTIPGLEWSAGSVVVVR